MTDHKTPLPSNKISSLETDSGGRHHITNKGGLPSAAPRDRLPVIQHAKPSDDNFELHVQTLLLQALGAMHPSGPNTTFDTDDQIIPALFDDRQLSSASSAPVDPVLLDKLANPMDGLSVSDDPVDEMCVRHEGKGERTEPAPKRSKLKPLPLGIALARGRSSRSRSPSPTRRERNHSKTNKQKTRVSRRTAHGTEASSEMGFCGKFTVSLDTWKDFRYFSIQATPYYPFHPDKHYSNPSGASHRALPIDADSSSCRRDRAPDTNGKVHLHWYIALNQPAKIGCPLEASPEAWDSRGQRLVPVTDVLEPSSGFHNKSQRDTLAKFYLLMYYRHACQQEGVVSATKVLSRLGIGITGKRYTPLVLICTFCGQYTDVEWQHIELYDSGALAQKYIASLGHDLKASTVRPMHIGILSVLTCNHIDCKNASRGGIPPRRSYGGRRDDEDLFCQFYTLKLSEGKHQNDMMKIVESPQEYFPPVLGGNIERLKWQRLGLDDNTVRYLRMEAFIDTVLKEYWSNCRVCGGHIQDAEVKDLSNASMSKFARKGVLCKESGECTWSEALEITTSQLEAKLGIRWVTMLERGRALRRGGPPPQPTLIQQRNSPQSPPSLILSDDSDFCTEHGSPLGEEKSGLVEAGIGEDGPTEEEEVAGGGDMELDEPGVVRQIKGAGVAAQEGPMEIEEDPWLDFIEQSGMLAPGEVMDWDE